MEYNPFWFGRGTAAAALHLYIDDSRLGLNGRWKTEEREKKINTHVHVTGAEPGVCIIDRKERELEEKRPIRMMMN
jgi:hypothetical protein